MKSDRRDERDVDLSAAIYTTYSWIIKHSRLDCLSNQLQMY